MSQAWLYLALFFVGALLCDFFFNVVYQFKWFGDDLENIPNQIFFRLHIMSLGLSMIGLIRTCCYAQKLLGLKYWIDWKAEITHLLRKIKANVTNAF